MMRLLRLLFLAAMMMVSCPAWAERLDLHYGVNEVDINGDGVKDVIVKARFDTGTAHSYDTYIVMIKLPKEERHDQEYFKVPREETGNGFDLDTAEGADCIVRDYKFELDAKHQLLVTRYDRDAGTQWCGAGKVTITTYRLLDTSAIQFDAQPPFILQKVKEKRTLKKYESVEQLSER